VHVDELLGPHVHLGALTVDLVGALAEHGVELRLRHRDQVRVRHPRAVEAVAGLALLVGGDLLERLRRHLRVATVRDEGAHAADREGAALVARLHEQLGVGPHERHGHRDLAAVGQDEPAPRPR
jgi:hypothetical protein